MPASSAARTRSNSGCHVRGSSAEYVRSMIESCGVVMIPLPCWAVGAGSRESDAVELEHPDGVAPQHLVRDLVVEAGVGDHLLDVVLRVRPRGVGVRVVGLEADVVDSDRLEVVEP